MKNWFLTDEEAKALRITTHMLGLRLSQVVLSVVLGVATLGSAIALAVVSAWLIARASQPHVIWFNLAIAATSVRMFGIGRALFRYLERLASHTVALHGLTNLRTSIYRILAKSPVSQVARLRQGEILARTGTDVDSIGDFVVRSLLPTITTAVVSLFIVLAFAFFSPLAALALALCLFTAGVLGPVLTIRSARLAEIAAQREQIELSAQAMHLLNNASELCVNGQLEDQFERLSSIEEEIKKTQDKAAQPAAWAALIDNLAMVMAVICGILIGVPLVVSGQLWDVNLAVLTLAPLAAFEGTAILAPAAVQLVVSAGAAARIVDLLGGVEQTKMALETLDRDERDRADKPISIGNIPNKELENPTQNISLKTTDLSIAWPKGPVLARGINLELKVGHPVAIVGASGIGKTTLLNTLAGLIKPASGDILINGKNIATMNRQDVCSRVVMTAEDAHVFYTTVLENLRVARGDLTEEEAWILLEKAGLDAWAKQLPKGLNTVIGSAGTTISGGERRRLLLARALATPAPLLLIDEPVEHLDQAMADRLVSDLLTAGTESDLGILLVTHRLSALDKACEVLVMGRPGSYPFTQEQYDSKQSPATVIARGTHQHLLDTVPSYAWALQQESIS